MLRTELCSFPDHEPGLYYWIDVLAVTQTCTAVQHMHAAAVEAAPATTKADITPKVVPLPTSEESEELLRIRHSVSLPLLLRALQLSPGVLYCVKRLFSC